MSDLAAIVETAKRFGLSVTSGQREAPPHISRFYATHSVPYGRTYRMYTTRGELIAYINRGFVADMPRTKIGYDNIGASLISPVVFGIPVYFD